MADDNVLDSEDVRYWMRSSDNLPDMESAVADNPADVNAWLKLAYKKVNATRG